MKDLPKATNAAMPTKKYGNYIFVSDQLNKKLQLIYKNIID